MNQQLKYMILFYNFITLNSILFRTKMKLFASDVSFMRFHFSLKIVYTQFNINETTLFYFFIIFCHIIKKSYMK
jgi:hypothetical protein